MPILDSVERTLADRERIEELELLLADIDHVYESYSDAKMLIAKTRSDGSWIVARDAMLEDNNE